MIGNSHKVTGIEFQVLSPPEGNSSILEVCDQDGRGFMHVHKSSENQFEITFLRSDKNTSLSLPILEEILNAAEKNLEYIDLKELGLE